MAARRAKLEDWERRSGQDPLKEVGLKSHLIFTWLHDVATHPAILDRIESLIGPDILIYSSSVWAKNARDGRFVSWHRDSVYLGIEPVTALQAWVALSDSNRENGCLRVLSESHVGPDIVHEETFNPKSMLTRGQVLPGVDVSKAVDVELRAGQFSLHHERTVHGSEANESDDRRIGYSILYMPASATCSLGRRGALLARGTDRYGHWDLEKPPVRDEDPEVLDYLTRVWASYRDRGVKQDAVA